MPLPTLIMGIFISSLYGALFHLWRGGSGGRLLLYLIFSWIGFWLGHFIGNLTGITFASLGALRLGTATLGSLVTLGIGFWLSLIDTTDEQEPKR